MHLCVVEDASSENLHPLTFFRPSYDLRCGLLTLRERMIHHLRPTSVVLHARSYLRAVLAEEEKPGRSSKRHDGRTVVVNGRVLMTPALARTLRNEKRPVVLKAGGQFVAAVLDVQLAERFQPRLAGEVIGVGDFEDMQAIEVDAEFINFPWDLVYQNGAMLHADAVLWRKSGPARGKGARIHRTAVLENPRNIRIGKNAIIGPGVVLDASDGPIFIGEGVRMYPHAVIIGPCAVGKGAQINIGAQIYENTTIGPSCKVGGEVEYTILHSHANKQHDGFLGYAYLCPWVNLGAGTTSSNLKNTYGSVRVPVNGREQNTGRMFVGLFAGDHAKTGINSTLNTGTVIGPSANIFGAGMPPKYIPGFSWGSADALQRYDVARALAVAETVMRRRNVEPTEAYRALFRFVHSLSEHERADNGRQ